MIQIQLRNVRNWKHECKFFSKKIVLIGFLLFKFQKYSREFRPLKFPLEGRKGGGGRGCGIQHPQNPSSLSQNPYFDHYLSYTIRASRCFFYTHCVKSVRIQCYFLIFWHLDWIRRDTPHVSEFSPNAGKYGPEKLRIRTLFTQWQFCS